MGFEIKLADWNQEKAKHCDSIKFRKLKAKQLTLATAKLIRDNTTKNIILYKIIPKNETLPKWLNLA